MNVLAVLLATMMTSMMTVSAIHNELEYCEFSAEKPIIKDCVLSDYDGNKFKLYELENGYAIYSLSDEQEVYGICGCGNVSVI